MAPEIKLSLAGDIPNSLFGLSKRFVRPATDQVDVINGSWHYDHGPNVNPVTV